MVSIPLAAYKCLGLATVSVVPSPKFQKYFSADKEALLGPV